MEFASVYRRESALKSRGFLQLTAELGGECTTFINVLSTDNDLISNLDTITSPDHVAIAIGNTTYYVNTSNGKIYTDKDLTTDALVYAGTKEGFVAMRVTKLVSNGETILRSDNPICIAFKDGKVKKINYSASQKTKMTLKIISEPREIITDGKKLNTWEYDKKKGLTFTLPDGTGVIEIT